jgi:hypothetical protein
MPTEDSLASRFDYLLEPLDVDEPVGRVGSRAEDSADETSRPSTAPLKAAFAAFVRAPFPHQAPPQGGGGGGLLGGRGLL